jgi:hypothetical protein
MTDFSNEEQERWGSFDDAKNWSDEDFLKKSPRQRLQWLESAQLIYRLGQARLKARQSPQSRGTS